MYALALLTNRPFVQGLKLPFPHNTLREKVDRKMTKGKPTGFPMLTNRVVVGALATLVQVYRFLDKVL